jgi:hypothetical protein
MRKFTFLALMGSIWLVATHAAIADEDVPLAAQRNWYALTGAVAGRVVQPGSGDIIYGGLSLGFGLTQHPTAKFSTSFGGRLVIDAPNNQVSLRGADASIGYHLIGGSPGMMEGGGTVAIRKIHRYSLSLVGKFTYAVYSISDTEGVSPQKISGSIASLRAGPAWRVGSYESQLIATFWVIPASTERIQENAIELALIYHWQS